MPRAARISITRDPRNPRLPHRVNIAGKLSASGKRERPAFATRSEAERCKAAEERRLAHHTERALGLTDSEKIEAAECKAMLEPFPGRTLRDATRAAVALWTQEEASVPLATLGGHVKAHGKDDGLTKTYCQKIDALLSHLSKTMPGAMISSVRPAQIDTWLRSQEISPVTRNNYRRHLSAGFGFARRRGWCKANPCEDVSTVSTPAQPVSILTPEEAEKVLRAASPSIVAWFALGLFAGLRPTEAAKLAWNDIGAETIRVRASIAKTRRNRFVPVLPVLTEWLARAERAKTGLVGCSRARFLDTIKAVDLFPWRKDCLRHSFGSYRWTILQHEGQLAQEMGNSPNIIISHYREVTDRATAERFFNLLPSNNQNFGAVAASEHCRVLSGDEK